MASKTEKHLLVLSSADVRQALPMPAAIAAMRTAFALLASGKVHLPARSVIRTPQDDGDLLIMPAIQSEGRRMGVKILSLFPGNISRGMPLIHALMALFDGETGQPLAVMDAGSLTAIRTSATCAVATDLLARRDARTLAVFGAGLQGAAQIEAIAAIRKLVKVWVFDPLGDKARMFASEMGERLGLDITAVQTPQEALANADIVSTATVSATPVFRDADLKPGVHVNAIGVYTPEKREIPVETVTRALLVVDQREACMAEAGDILIPIKNGIIGAGHVAAELGELVLGIKPGRTSEEQVTLFKAVGLAIQDLAAAWQAYETARQTGLGQSVPL
ncbi:MAG: ornithine cyclodeaminase family protein [Candidatus Sumerlaeota bacterium]|nr:ornithine cyclodeaminase family protein [Candidatus Sumerlaeota bacterium]